MKEQFTKDVSARYTYLQDLLYSASALDPHFKDLSFLDDSDTTKDMVFMKITTAVLKMTDMIIHLLRRRPHWTRCLEICSVRGCRRRPFRTELRRKS
ncbi:unnamed protein product [Knipowitschia caucasica]